MNDDQDERRAVPPQKEPSAPTTSAAGAESFAETPSENFQRQAEARRTASAESDTEEQLWQGGYSPKAMVGTWLICALLTIAAVVVTVMFDQLPWLVTLIAVVVLWVIVGGIYGVRRMGTHYQLTTQRFLHQTGLLSRRTDRIEVIDIDDVSYEQGPIQRMFGIGTIRIDSSDRSHPVLTMRGIEAVQDVAGLIDEIRRKERRRRSLHIESI